MLYKGQELEEFKIKKYAVRNDFVDLSGKIFGSWYVICRAPNKKGTKYWCECTLCGRIKTVFANGLKSGATTRCHPCSNLKVAAEKHKFYEGIPISLWTRFQTGAKKRKKNFKITIEEAWLLFLKQNKKCALSGLEIGFCTEKKNNGIYKGHRYTHTASLDRIDSKGHYTLDNCQWVDGHINRMKSIYDQKYFLYLCKKINEYQNNI